MKVLVSTKETQGDWGRRDFCCVPEGELVTFAMECDSDDRWDGRCGCRRSMVGMECLRATTSFKIEDQPDMTPGEFLSEVRKSFKKAGWAKYHTPEEATAIIREDAQRLTRLACLYPTGTVLGKRGSRIFVRKNAATEAFRVLTNKMFGG